MKELETIGEKNKFVKDPKRTSRNKKNSELLKNWWIIKKLLVRLLMF